MTNGNNNDDAPHAWNKARNQSRINIGQKFALMKLDLCERTIRRETESFAKQKKVTINECWFVAEVFFRDDTWIADYFGLSLTLMQREAARKNAIGC